MGRPSKILTKEDILLAQSRTLSNKAAARFLRVSYIHYKKYASLYKDEETGKTLLELHSNPSGKGIRKITSRTKDELPLDDIMNGRVPTNHLDPVRIKERLIFEFILEEKCSLCGLSEKRIKDGKIPLVLHFRDGDDGNYRKENLELLCFNCSFLYGNDPMTETKVTQEEVFVQSRDEEPVPWEVDDFYMEHLKELGLVKPEPRPGEEYISRL